jgi:asparagine synthase (glutamine-hydrolysing)
MCGIAGNITLSQNQDVDKNLIVAMCDALKHRGPDGEGYVFSRSFSFHDFEMLRNRRPEAHINIASSDRAVALGHRRLSIIDLHDNASQPMCDADESVWIVLNGEIYNHRELRETLTAKGHVFKTDHSDTEALLHAYKEWGLDCLLHLRGMFAFAIWDIRKDLIMIARDRMGVKPVYYHVHHQQLNFASEIKALLQNKNLDRRINYSALNELLTYNSVAAPNTLYDGIFKLKPAHYITIEKGVVSEQTRYWNLHEETNQAIDSEDLAVENIREVLQKSIELRMESDVPYGALLSGGIDSSANVAFLHKLSDKPVNTFSLGFSSHHNFKLNEFAYADEVASLFRTKHHKIEISDNDFWDFINQYQHHFDEPIVDSASIPIYFLAENARKQGIKILLGGEGSDELFIGYQLWRFNYEFNKMFAGKSKWMLKGFKAILNLPPLKNKRPFYRHWLQELIDGGLIFNGGTVVLTPKQKARYYTPLFIDKAKVNEPNHAIENYFKEFKSESKDWGKWMTYLDTKIRLPELLLARLDKMTMVASVEAREPFIDYKLAELSYRINSKLKTRDKTEKYILKKALKGILPSGIIYRQKDGFTVPLEKLFENDKLRKFAIEKINELNSVEQIFTSEYINKLWKEKDFMRLWQLLMIAIWWDNYIINVPSFVDENGRLIPEHL